MVSNSQVRRKFDSDNFEIETSTNWKESKLHYICTKDPTPPKWCKTESEGLNCSQIIRGVGTQDKLSKTYQLTVGVFHFEVITRLTRVCLKVLEIA